MKPLIGIFPSYNEEKKQIFLNQSYLDAIIESGGIPVTLPLLQASTHTATARGIWETARTSTSSMNTLNLSSRSFIGCLFLAGLWQSIV